MDTTQPIFNFTEEKKEPLVNGKVTAGGFFILAGAFFLIPYVLMFAAPSLLFMNPNDELLVSIFTYVIPSLLVGTYVGYRVKHEFLNGLVLSIMMLGYIELMVVPQHRMGVDSLIQYAWITALPIILSSSLFGLAIKTFAKKDS